MQKLTLSFLYAQHGPLILKHLQGDTACASNFSREICALIEKKEPLLPAEYEALVTAFAEKACPAFKNKPRILNWVFSQYETHLHNGKPIQSEDLYKIGESLDYFESLKRSGALQSESKDLLSYKSYQQFLDALKPFEKKKAQKEAAKFERFLSPKKQRDINAETTILYQGPLGKVVMPHTVRSSQYWGNNTKWCISGKKAKKFFLHYQYRSPIIMLIPKGREDDKIALVEETLYNSQDNAIKCLPREHYGLLKACLGNLKPKTRKNLKAWIPDHALSITHKSSAVILPASNVNAVTVPPAWKEFLFIMTYSHLPASISLDLLTNRDFMLLAIKRRGGTFKYADETLKADREFVLAAVKQNGLALEYVDETLKADREIVLAAVNQNGLALGYADETLKADREIVLAAVKQSGYALKYAAKELRLDASFIAQCLQENDILPFWMELDEPIEGVDLWQPNKKALIQYKVAALERMIEKGDIEQFHRLTCCYPSTWGDADTVFAGNLQETLTKIKADMVIVERMYSTTQTRQPHRLAGPG